MAFSQTALRRAVTTSVLTAAISVGPFFAAIAQALTLQGAGATFPVPLYQRYAAEVQKKYPDLRVNYQGIGSGGGIRQVIAETVDFGGSDAAMTDAQMAEVKRGVILVPTAGGAVALVYNLPGVSNLKLPREVYPEIFAGRIRRWNDPKISAANPGVNLPNLPIKTAVRADSSGTTFIVTNHFSTIDPYFKGKIGTNTAPRWVTQPLKGKGNAGVAALVKQTPGTIGYVEYSYAKQNNLQVAALENKKGEYVAPSLEAANKALATVQFPDNFRVFEGDPAEGYPVTGLTWMMVYKNYNDPSKAQAVKQWVEWVLTQGQELNDDLDYTRIPADVAQRALQTVQAEVK